MLAPAFIDLSKFFVEDKETDTRIQSSEKSIIALFLELQKIFYLILSNK